MIFVPDLAKRVYAAASAPEALDMSEWHRCSTCHCWAGWIVHIAGEEGYALEDKYRHPTLFDVRPPTMQAALDIADVSGCPVDPLWFYCGDEERTLARMKEWAGLS